MNIAAVMTLGDEVTALPINLARYRASGGVVQSSV